jgi:hypothetical protein
MPSPTREGKRSRAPNEVGIMTRASGDLLETASLLSLIEPMLPRASAGLPADPARWPAK